MPPPSPLPAASSEQGPVHQVHWCLWTFDLLLYWLVGNRERRVWKRVSIHIDSIVHEWVQSAWIEERLSKADKWAARHEQIRKSHSITSQLTASLVHTHFPQLTDMSYRDSNCDIVPFSKSSSCTKYCVTTGHLTWHFRMNVSTLFRWAWRVRLFFLAGLITFFPRESYWKVVTVYFWCTHVHVVSWVFTHNLLLGVVCDSLDAMLYICGFLGVHITYSWEWCAIPWTSMLCIDPL